MREEKRTVMNYAKAQTGKALKRGTGKAYLTLLALLCLSFLLILSGCQAGVKLNPSDSDLPDFTVRPEDDSRAQAETKADADKSEEEAETKEDSEKADEEKDAEAEKSVDKAEKTDSEKADKDSEDAAAEAEKDEDKDSEAKDSEDKDSEEKDTEAAAEVEEDAPPTAQEVQAKLKEKGFNFYVNNLVNDPEPESVVYSDKEEGKAELTVFYAFFKDAKTADQAIANLLESDMIGKAISFGAKLEKVVDESGKKLYTVNLKSFFATARAEMRQDGERIGLVLLYKKNDEVEFEPYFELMGFEKPE